MNVYYNILVSLLMPEKFFRDSVLLATTQLSQHPCTTLYGCTTITWLLLVPGTVWMASVGSVPMTFPGTVWMASVGSVPMTSIGSFQDRIPQEWTLSISFHTASQVTAWFQGTFFIAAVQH